MKPLLLLALTLFFFCCNPNNKEIPSPVRAIWGADVSWVTEMEASGWRFYNNTGTQQDPFILMKDLGAKAIRLRVWVNPTDGWNGYADLLTKARRAHQLGLRLLINFHYSDSWADPGKQNPPTQWISYNVSQLQSAIRTHTRDVLMGLKAEGIRPDWVQVGNETNDGMLWPLGKASVSMSNYAAFFREGYEAVKSVDSSIQVMVHLSNGYDIGLYEWNLNGLKQAGATWDVVGMSLYPSVSNWQVWSDQVVSNMKWIIDRYQTPVMVAEVGMPVDQSQTCYNLLSYLKGQMDSIPNAMALGIFYWEPQCYGRWKGYGLGAFDDSGRPTRALDAFSIP